MTLSGLQAVQNILYEIEANDHASEHTCPDWLKYPLLPS